MNRHRKVAQTLRGRVSDPRLAALSGSQTKAPGSAGGYLLWVMFACHVQPGPGTRG
jgi:hypothetical protein